MAPKIFALGTTGYIGGDALYTLLHAHPELEGETTCLVRNPDRAAALAAQYPKVRLVYGTLDDASLIEEESKKADIVCHWAHADHVVAAEAITKGLSAHEPDSPGYWIHTSGTGILLFADIERKVFGEASTKVYDDWDGLSEVTSLPDFAPHRDVDKIVLAAGTAQSDRVKTAIVCPPTIYGPGRGPGNQRSIQVYELARCTLERKEGLKVGKGEAHWTNVHVHDLSNVYLSLVEAAIQGGGKATWGSEGYYFTEHGEHVWGDISQKVATAAYKKGLIPSDKVVSISVEEANELSGAGLTWGANSRARSIRARKLFGWSPKGRSLDDEIPDIVDSEAKRAGLVKGHAAKAAGEA